ncbi:MAG: 1-deoxy-D-xylulose-5-phosphate synthase [Clostridia bacterium]|nr:1-deoxy-D-xylulose-5-phosphate synthase [Clostridia bacterium]
MILQGISGPSDVKKLNFTELALLADEMREEMISAINDNGGHLSSNLGVLETTVALYKTFDFPKDKLIFDVGHQCYAHKMLSGRREKLQSIRTKGGLAGFPDCSESEYDPFTTGHAGNSIALGLGLCTARDRNNEDYYVVTVVGDGAFVNGLNLEAINATETKPKRFIVILNDNGMSISKNRNGFYHFISRATIKKGYVKNKNVIKKIFGNSAVTAVFRGVRNFFKRVINKSEYFDRFGFKYVGIVDGNDIKKTATILERVKQASNYKAIFLHIKTTKGKGLKNAEDHSDLYHSVGKNLKCGGNNELCLGNILSDLIEKDDKIVAITAGMKDGTGLSCLEKRCPDHLFDVGIAEEYAVTFAAGLAKGGLKPVVAVYSTFLQRAYDEIVHDVCLQNLPVVFCVDRAGFVGEDGKTHQGLFDLSYTTHIPNMTVLAPMGKAELKSAIEYAFGLSAPVWIRYSKSSVDIPAYDYKDKRWQTLKGGTDITVFTVGGAAARLALEFAEKYDKSVKVVAARVVKPLDEKILLETKTPVITVEENAVIGGFGSMVATFLANNNPLSVYTLGVKDEFVGHGSVKEQLEDNGFTTENLTVIADRLLKK